jgi:2-methylcitrate dehydratase PrpD
MAREGYHGASNLIETDGGLTRALVQDRAVSPQKLDFSDGWEIKRNTFKPYASCLLTHPSIDAGRDLHTRLQSREVKRVTVHVDPLCIQLAGITNPKTPFEGKFSLAFCTALALEGYIPTQREFTSQTLENPRIQGLVSRVDLVPDAAIDKTAATVEVAFSNGEKDLCHVPLARGNPGRPMSWEDMKRKFSSLVQPVLAQGNEEIFDQFKAFDHLADLTEIRHKVTGKH